VPGFVTLFIPEQVGRQRPAFGFAPRWRIRLFRGRLDPRRFGFGHRLERQLQLRNLGIEPLRATAEPHPLEHGQLQLQGFDLQIAGAKLGTRGGQRGATLC